MTFAEKFVYPWLIPAAYRLARLVTRRQPPTYRGWQDFELGTYVTDPAPVERVKYIDILPDLTSWQEEMLKHQVWGIRHRLLKEHLRPEDFTVALGHDGSPHHDPVPVTIFGMPFRLDPNVPLDHVRIERKPDTFPAPPTDHALILPGYGGGLGSYVEVPGGDTASAWKPLPIHGAPGAPPHEYRRNGRKVEIRRCTPDLRIGLYNEDEA